MPKTDAAGTGWTFDDAGFFVLRTPLLAQEEIAWLHDGGSAASAADVLLRRAAVRTKLAELLDRPDVLESLGVASTSLKGRIAAWRAAPESSEGQKIETALVRYVLRMAWRSTPFGLLAGVTHGRIADRQRLTIAGRARYRRGVRLDMSISRALADAALADADTRLGIVFVPNEAMYLAAGRWQVPRVVEKGETRNYEQMAVTPDEAFDLAIGRAKAGATLPEIVEALLPLDVTKEQALEYANELVSAGVLVSTAVSTMTGDDFVAPLERAVRPESSVGRALAAARESLRGLNEAPLGEGVGAYDVIREAIAVALPSKDRKHVLQVDLSKPGDDTTLGRTVVDEIAKGTRALHALFGVRDEGPALVAFRRAFERRYETRVVPLMEVLDDEVGIGFPEPQARTLDPVTLLAGLGLPVGEAHSFPTPETWGPAESLLLERLSAVWRSGAATLELREHDLRRFESMDRLPLPDSFAALVALHARGPDDPAFNVAFTGVVGPSGARLVARFCPWDETMTSDVRAHLRREEALQPEAVFAEVVHLPDGSRAGNVLLRPVLREHEIAFCARGGADAAKQLRLEDLLVTVRSGRIVLSSRALGREVVPRLSSAHNTMHRQLPVYRFLGRLQEQGVSPHLAWNWGPFVNAMRLPRVTYGRCIFSLARWRLDEAQIKKVSVKDPFERLSAAQRLRADLKLPRFVALEDGDNLLTIDFDSSLVVDAWVDAIRGRSTARLVEILGVPDDDVVRGPEGRFRHEIIVPFVRRAPKKEENASSRGAAKPAVAARAAPSPVVRHLPGSEWLYVKLYCGRRGADRVLASCVAPAAEEALASGAADSWFFIRYGDPEPHLRVRLHGSPGTLAGEVLPRLVARARPLVDSGLVLRVQVDTYEPEVERYGGPVGTDLSERLFYADSVAAVQLVALVASASDPEEARWAVACASMHALLEDSDLEVSEVLRFIGAVRASYADEMKATGGREHALARRFREHRALVESVLGEAPPPPFDGARAVLEERSRSSRALLRQLHDLERAGTLASGFEALLGSHLHMCANRLLHADARAQELVLSSFLERVYASREARQRPRNSTSGA